MASTEAHEPIGQPTADLEAGEAHNESNSLLKRQASPQDDEESSIKHQRQDDDSPSAKRQRISRTPDYVASKEERPVERAKPATQEEKKRGKRLFGGLLSTLNQRTSNSQLQRRQEIERRQQERIQKQEALDDKERGKKAVRLRVARLAEQITFDERVMTHRHTKKLALAKLLKTRSRPHIYYLPWKCTDEQRDILEDQIRDAEHDIERELKAFEAKREGHIRKYGPPRQAPHAAATNEESRQEPVRETAAEIQSTEAFKMDEVSQTATAVSQEDRRPRSKDGEDLGDIIEEAGDDAVIY